MTIPDNLKLDVTTAFKKIMLDKKLKQYQAGEKLGMHRGIYNRLLLKNELLRLSEVAYIADGLDCDVKLSFVDRQTGREWACD